MQVCPVLTGTFWPPQQAAWLLMATNWPLRADNRSDEEIRAVIRRPLASSPFNVPTVAIPIETFEVGDRVTYDRYGLGSVIAVEPDIAVVVDFGIQRARIVTPYSKLTKL
ncbi:MAG: hypothetical protein QOJ62_1777 [Actinomycetota bacterium]|nr:hypothetical protein [Actinomycetota bacterium]